MNRSFKNILSDPEFYFLLFMNGVLIYLFKKGSLDPVSVVWIFYFQNILIGIQYFIRMMSLDKFSTGNLRVNNQSVESTTKVKQGTAYFFALHYGLFHFGYFILLLVVTAGAGFRHFDFVYFNTAIFALVINTLFSTISQVRQDRPGLPNISTMMFIPYLRILPMHVFLIAGLGLEVKSGIMKPVPGDLFIIFLLLKGLSDMALYVITNKTWKAKRPRVISGVS